MANSIGGVSCSLIHGRLADLKTDLVVWRRPGMSGYVAMDMGDGDADGSLILTKYDSAADVRNWCASAEALQGHVVTVIIDDVSYTNLLVEHVSPLEERGIISADGNTRGRLAVRVKRT